MEMLKGACTRIDTYVCAVDTVDELTREQLSERRARLSTCWDEYNSIQLRIEDIDASEVRDRETFEELFYTLCAKIARLIRSNGVGTSARSSPRIGGPGSFEHSDGTGGFGDAGSRSHIRLPKLNLPTFSGKYDQWFPFFDSFKGTVHNNESLPKFEKFQYLKAALSGEALAVIDTLEISEANYGGRRRGAWDLLQERYDNKRLIVYTHIKGLMELPQLQRENALDIRRMCDSVLRHMRALTSLKCKADSWDDLIIYILSAKLDPTTQREWQNSLIGSTLPTFKQFTEFLAHRSRVLESTSARDATASRRVETRAMSRNENRRQALHATATGNACTYCRGDHSIYACVAFGELPVNQRIAEMRKRKMCLNCLRSTSHRAAQCPSGNCRICKGRHSSLVHLKGSLGAGSSESGTDRAPSSGSAVTASESISLMTHGGTGGDASYVFLSTAMVYVQNKNNTRTPIRALLDSGSQANFVTTRAAKLLSLTLRPINIAISGVGKITTNSTRATRLTVRSRAGSFVADIECIVTDRITDKIPAVTIRRGTINLPANIQLADPQYFKAAEIDMLIGAELFWQLLCVGQIRATQSHPTLQKTRLGWILAGRVSDASSVAVRAHAFHATITNARLHESLNRFWDLDEIASHSSGTLHEQACEAHFMSNVATDATGRYVVKLPIKPGALTTMGQSRDIAIKRFYNLERRFACDAQFKAAYAEFMKDYLRLGHMRLVADSEVENPRAVYLPHHGVFKGDAQNGRLRVVFDASARDSREVSLNDVLMTGPTVQQDLLSILLRFRIWKYVFSADVIKMYRQIRVHDSQTHLQRVVWRDCPKEYPIGSRHIINDFYVDDLLTGANALGDAIRARDEIVKILRDGQFELSKWLANHRDLLPHDVRGERESVSLSGDAEHKILGVIWDPSNDKFKFETRNEKQVGRVTKRAVLAELAGLFDPMGIVGPIIVVAKIMLQMWQLRVDWDESLPQEIDERWRKFRQQLQRLRDLKIPRWTGYGGERETQIHGFCDASERAYGACVYIRTATSEGQYRVALLTSKSRVAPIKAVSLPRLELSAAVLLTQLIEKVRSSIEMQRNDVILWSDSTIALQWIASPSRR
ncbi:uncharacterized protein [Cardiocondyla obscurior]|uniref:uncharacterized protein n=1 Tax=Cardiocondyla obscurior TaxID=286306 RepID=UPI0039656B9F